MEQKEEKLRQAAYAYMIKDGYSPMYAADSACHMAAFARTIIDNPEKWGLRAAGPEPDTGKVLEQRDLYRKTLEKVQRMASSNEFAGVSVRKIGDLVKKVLKLNTQ